MKTFAIFVLLLISTSYAQKATVKAPAKASVKVAAKPKVTAKVTPKAKVGVKVSTPKVTVPKVGISIKAGAKTTAKTTAKVSAAVTGTCPLATAMGFKTQKAAAIKGLKICPMLKTTCCDATSINAFADKWLTNTKKLGAVMWTVVKTGSAMTNLMMSLKTGFGDAASKTPAAAKKLRILQAVAKPKAKASVKVAAKPKVTTPKAKVGVKVTAKPKVTTPKAKVGVKVTTPKVTVPKAKVGLKTGVKASTGVKVTGSVKKTASVKVTVKAGSLPTVLPSKWNAGSPHKAKFDLAWAALNKMMGERDSVYDIAQKCFLEVVKLRAQLACAVCDNNNEKFFSKNASILDKDLTNFQQSCASFIAYAPEYYGVAAKVYDYIGSVTGNKQMKDEALVAKNTAGAIYGLSDCADAPAKKLRILQAKVAAKPKVTTPKAKVGVKVAAKPKVTTPKAKVGVKVTTPKVTVPKAKVGVKIGTSSTPSAKISGSTKAKVTVKATAKSSTDSWTAWRKSGKLSVFAPKLKLGAKCLASGPMANIAKFWIFDFNEREMMGLFNDKWAVLGKAYELAAHTSGLDQWKKFKGTIVGSVPKSKRRLQAVVKATPTLVASPTGLNVSVKYAKTGLAMPKGMAKDASQVEFKAGNILSFGIFGLLVLLFN